MPKTDIRERIYRRALDHSYKTGKMVAYITHEELHYLATMVKDPRVQQADETHFTLLSVPVIVDEKKASGKEAVVGDFRRACGCLEDEHPGPECRD